MDEELRLKLTQSFLEWKAANAGTISTLTQQCVNEHIANGNSTRIFVIIIWAIALLATSRIIYLNSKDDWRLEDSIAVPIAIFAISVSIVSTIFMIVAYTATPGISELLLTK